MLELLTDVTRVERIDYPNEDVLASGVQGCWGFINAAGNFQLVGTGTDLLATNASTKGNVFCVWTEQKRTNSLYPTVTAATEKTAFVPAFTPDTTQTNKVTVLNGKFRARTSQWTIADQNSGGSALTAGLPLRVWSGGQLAKATIGTDAIVAYVLKPAYTYEYLGTTYSVIDIAVI